MAIGAAWVASPSWPCDANRPGTDGCSSIHLLPGSIASARDENANAPPARRTRARLDFDAARPYHGGSLGGGSSGSISGSGGAPSVSGLITSVGLGGCNTFSQWQVVAGETFATKDYKHTGQGFMKGAEDKGSLVLCHKPQ